MNQSLESPCVSVIVPVYNVERYLAQCLDALCSQTLPDMEIIVIDDGSTDSSPQILAKYAGNDGRIRVITKPNEGYGATINRGIAEAKGAYIGIVESDDYPEPDMFEVLYDTASSFDADLVKCDFYDLFEDGESPRNNLAALPSGVVTDAIEHPELLLIIPSIWAALYRRDFLLDAGITCRTTPGAAFQDTSFCLKCLMLAQRCVFVQRPLLHYRRDNPNASTQTNDKVFTVADEFQEVRNFVSAADAERYHRLCATMRLGEWNTHRWDITRIAPESRVAYLSRIRDEFRKADSAGEIDRVLFETDELMRLELLLSDDASDAAWLNALATEYFSEEPIAASRIRIIASEFARHAKSVIAHIREGNVNND